MQLMVDDQSGRLADARPGTVAEVEQPGGLAVGTHIAATAFPGEAESVLVRWVASSCDTIGRLSISSEAASLTVAPGAIGPPVRHAHAAQVGCEMLYTVLYMPSTRTQIYLTDDQRRRLDARGRRTGASMARLIREAVDAYLADGAPDTQAALDETFGTLLDLEIPDRSEWARDADPDR